MKESMKKEISLQLKRVVALFIMGSIAITSAFSVAALSRKVRITDGATVKNVVTLNTDTDKILQQADIVLSKDDKVVRDESDKEVINITVNRAFTIEVVDGDFSRTAVTTDCSAKDLIEKMGIELSNNDEVYPSLDSTVTKDTQKLYVVRRCNMILTVDGETKEVLAPIGSVEDALKYLGINLGENDELNVDKNSHTYNNIRVNVDRVEYKDVVSTEEIPFKLVSYISDTMYEGESVIGDEGANGEQELLTRQKFVNGKLIESQRVSENITKQPRNQVKTIGIKKRGSSSASLSGGYTKDNNDGTLVDHFGNTISYKSVLRGLGSAYTASAGATTSTGRPACYGNVAVDPKIIPYGTRLYICSVDGRYIYGYAVAADTGGAMLSGSRLVDLYYNTLGECYQFGVRSVNVYVLD